MIKFKYSQANWKLSVLFPVISVLIFNMLQNYLELGWAMLWAIGTGIILQFLLDRYFISVIEFRDSYLVLRKGLFKKEVKIDYSDISKITYLHSRFLRLYLYTAASRIEVPPPARLNKAEELFQWLTTKNPAIEFAITK